MREQGLLEKGMTTGFDWSVPPPASPAPGRWKPLWPPSTKATSVIDIVGKMRDEQMFEMVKFPSPKTIGDVKD